MTGEDFREALKWSLIAAVIVALWCGVLAVLLRDGFARVATGCATIQGTAMRASGACIAFSPITFSAGGDTRETIAQLRGHKGPAKYGSNAHVMPRE